MIYLPGTGIFAAYVDSATGLPTAEFNNALGMFCWAWFILTVIFTIAAMRSSWALFLTLAFLDLELLLLAVGYMMSSNSTLIAANSVGFIVAFCSCEFVPLPAVPPSPNLTLPEKTLPLLTKPVF